MGLWLVLYLVEHLLVNSQAALWMGDDGSGFVRMVNSLESLPYLHVVEILFIGIPLAIHLVWGLQRIWMAKTNSGSGDGSKPALHYGRNRAFSWQRWTSWILLFGILGHVAQMRFLNAPMTREIEGKKLSVVKITMDEQLPILAERLHVKLVTEGKNVLAVAETPGTAMLLMVRDAFKSVWMAVLYTVFLGAAAFHAMNGLWTFLITWGAILSVRSQKAMMPVSVIGMGLLLFLGLAAIWGSYWLAS
jgi:succinate dehydrogenase / fumarate reductase cytochrome b subunit